MIVLILAIILQYVEVYYLWYYYNSDPASHNYLASTIIVSFSLVYWLIQNPSFGHNQRITKLGQYTLGIYVMHFLFVDLFQSLAPYIAFGVWDIVFPAIVYLTTLGCVMLLSKIPGINKLVT